MAQVRARGARGAGEAPPRDVSFAVNFTPPLPYLPQRRPPTPAALLPSPPLSRPGDNVSTQSSHVHVGACVPHRQRITGDLTLHILVQKHQFPDGATASAPVEISVTFRVVAVNNNGTDSRWTVKFNVPASSWACNPSTLCKAVRAPPPTLQAAGRQFALREGERRAGTGRPSLPL